MRASTFILVITIIAVAQIGCGASGPPRVGSLEYCQSELSELLSDEEVCSPIMVEQLEGEVKDWQKQCQRHAEHSDRERVDEKLEQSRACADQELRREARRRACSEKVIEIAERDPCTGEICLRNLEEMNKAITECGEVELEGASLELAQSMVKQFEKQIAEDKQIEALVFMKDECARIAPLTQEGQAVEVLERLIEKVGGSEEIRANSDSGKKLTEAREAALKSCGETLQPAAADIAVKAADELADKKVKRDPPRWTALYQSIEKYQDRLNAIDAAALFPGSMDTLNKTLKDHEGSKSKLENAAKKKLASKARAALTKGAKRCKNLYKKIKNFRYKVESYKEQGNAKKSGAYQAKLKKTEQALETLKEEIQRGIETKALPEDALQRMLAKLKQAGCGVDSAAEPPPETKTEPEKKSEPEAQSEAGKD